MNTARRDVFQAIADPTRRTIIGILSGCELTLNQLSDKFKISRPAVSKHVKVLEESGLVEIRKLGREHYCRARLEKLREAAKWLDRYREFWEGNFDRLGKFLEESKPKEERRGAKK